MANWLIREAEPKDKVWITKLIARNADILGKMDGGQLFYRWLHRTNRREQFLVVEDVGFVHYLERLDGTKVVYEMAVSIDFKRRGIGAALLNAVGNPVLLKTNASSDESNAFYRALGFVKMGKKTAKSGVQMVVYQRW